MAEDCPEEEFDEDLYEVVEVQPCEDDEAWAAIVASGLYEINEVTNCEGWDDIVASGLYETFEVKAEGSCPECCCDCPCPIRPNNTASLWVNLTVQGITATLAVPAHISTLFWQALFYLTCADGRFQQWVVTITCCECATCGETGDCDGGTYFPTGTYVISTSFGVSEAPVTPLGTDLGSASACCDGGDVGDGGSSNAATLDTECCDPLRLVQGTPGLCWYGSIPLCDPGLPTINWVSDQSTEPECP